jgi:F-type H+-transporting ATPase subunit gamma
MPQNLREIRRKIKTVQSIWKITRAMKMVAAAKLRRLQASVESGRVYWQRLDDIMAHVGAQAGEVSHPFLETSDVPDVAVLVIGGARGLCGSYNVALLRQAGEFAAATRRPMRLTTVGPRARLFFARQGITIQDELEVPDEKHRLLQARDISRTLRTAFLNREVGEVHAVYTHFHSAIHNVPTVRQILPIVPPAPEPGGGTGAVHQRACIFEPPAEQLLGSLLPRAIDAMIYEMLLQSAASEEGSRMAAMTAATDNAQEMTTNLTRELNRARQSQITSEILEIVSGADALTNA